MYMGALLPCTFVYYMHSVPTEARGGCQTPQDWSYRCGFRALNPSSPEEQSVLLTNEPSHLSSPWSILKGWKVWFLIALSRIKSFCLFYMTSGKGEMKKKQPKRMCLWQFHCLRATGSSGCDFASSLLKSYSPRPQESSPDGNSFLPMNQRHYRVWTSKQAPSQYCCQQNKY